MEHPTKTQWRWALVGLLLLAGFQTVDIGMKLRSIRALRPVLKPEMIKYAYTVDDHPNRLPVHIGEAAMNAEWLDDQVYGPYADDDWASLFPRSNGWVALGPNQEMYVLSMFHQLHCLDALRYGYVTAKAGTLQFPGNGTGVEHHVNHCLTYLKEMLLCAGDTTLETSMPVTNAKGEIDHGATGNNIVHRCRDWTQIRDYLEENYEERKRRGGTIPGEY
ncbi:hypothetical protein DENSPDRAFT_835274 [Dentipellis sp. KUC8613]|nr:hypothetical protein DENSPDRAFT_835274 [Dentipellis sp. KUC8613]